MTAPRQSPTQHPAQHPSLCSRDESDGGGHSFQQPSSHATHTPVSINRLAWGHQQHIMTSQDQTCHLPGGLWCLTKHCAALACVQKGKNKLEKFTIIIYLTCPCFRSVLKKKMLISVLSSLPTLPVHHRTWDHPRKPMRKEENGTSRSEYAMTSSQNNKTVDNNAVV